MLFTCSDVAPEWWTERVRVPDTSSDAKRSRCPQWAAACGESLQRAGPGRSAQWPTFAAGGKRHFRVIRLERCWFESARVAWTGSRAIQERKEDWGVVQGVQVSEDAPGDGDKAAGWARVSPVLGAWCEPPCRLAGLGRARSRSSVLRAVHLKSWNFARPQENRFSPGSQVSHAWWFVTPLWRSPLWQRPAFPRVKCIGYAG